MAITSQFPGKCKDCGKSYNKGDMIDTNGNESPNKQGEMKAHWCPDGENCQGSMDLSGSGNSSDGPAQQALNAARQVVESNQNYMSAKIEGIEANYNALPDEQKQHYGIFVLYMGHLKRCRDMGITDHIEAQMLFKMYIHRLNASGMNG